MISNCKTSKLIEIYNQSGYKTTDLPILQIKDMRSVEALLLVKGSGFKGSFQGASGFLDHLIPDLLEKRPWLPSFKHLGQHPSA